MNQRYFETRLLLLELRTKLKEKRFYNAEYPFRIENIIDYNKVHLSCMQYDFLIELPEFKRILHRETSIERFMKSIRDVLI